MKGAFRKLLALLAPDAPLVACADFPHVLDVCRDTRARVVRFGVGPESTWRVTDLVDDGRVRFAVREDGKNVLDVTLRVPG